MEVYMREQMQFNEDNEIDLFETDDFIATSEADEEDEDVEYLELQKEAGEESLPLEFRDLSLKEEAGEKLAFHEDIDASSVSLEARNGIVTLMGSVATDREKLEAAECLFDLDGVVDVINDLEVR